MKKNNIENEKQETFVSHLSELRSRLIKSFLFSELSFSSMLSIFVICVTLDCTSEKYLLIVPVQEPIFLSTMGKSFGPITNIAIITMISNSNHPICGIVNIIYC